MNDRELLRLAALAVGLTLSQEWGATQDGILTGAGDGDLEVWNPLVDDGHALRLAVKLGFRVYVYPGGNDSNADTTVVAGDELANRTPWAQEPHRGDRYAATRRAIVRAAAELGSTLASQ